MTNPKKMTAADRQLLFKAKEHLMVAGHPVTLALLALPKGTTKIANRIERARDQLRQAEFDIAELLAADAKEPA